MVTQIGIRASLRVVRLVPFALLRAAGGGMSRIAHGSGPTWIARPCTAACVLHFGCGITTQPGASARTRTDQRPSPTSTRASLRGSTQTARDGAPPSRARKPTQIVSLDALRTWMGSVADLLRGGIGGASGTVPPGEG